MKAQVFYGPGDLRFEEMPVPEPGPGEIVMRIEAALTCGTDVKVLRRGHPVMIPHVPTVFGHEFAGAVARAGRGVTDFREGDRVVAANSAPCGACRCCRAGRQNLCEDLLFVNGGFGEYIALPPRLVATNVVRLGPSLPARRAAFAEPLACALLGIERGRVEKGMTVAVIGHGPLGCLLALVAAQRGARVFLVGKPGWRLDRVKGLGIERGRVEKGMTVAVIGHGPLGCLLALVAAQRGARVLLVGKPGWRLDRVRALGIAECLDAGRSPSLAPLLRDVTGGRGVDVAVDATGRPEVWEQAVAAVGRGGTVVFFGGCAPGTSVVLDTRRVHYEELALVGAFHHTPALIRQAVALLESEALVPDGLLTHTMGLADVREALDLMERGQALKVLIEPYTA
ncbi:MAG: alcohol dehydrogenase catalytic domain-containing protein [Candidatus Rokubacteria bacterium]|nr:alcohol dehydrogenase catalytic domain-containing protein [Candidatus Rokubacteria bacterium]